MLIDIATSGDGHVINKESENNLKQNDLTTEIQRVRDVTLLNPAFLNQVKG